MSPQSSELDIRLVTTDEIEETEASQAARTAARRFGEVEASSYSTFEGRPVLWAFDVSREPHRLIVGGVERREARVLLFVEPDDAFTGMLYAKALAGYSRDTIEAHAVTQIDQQVSQASWFCDAFYLSRHRIDGMQDADVVAVMLHAHEVGLNPDATEAAVLRRTPDLVSTPDAQANHPAFRDWVKLIRSLRRLIRLRELSAPQMIIDNEIQLAKRTWRRADLTSLANWPEDVRALASELVLT